MPFRLLLLCGIILLSGRSCPADALDVLRALESIEGDLARYRKELKEIRAELGLTIEKQARAQRPDFAAELEKLRAELEETVATLSESQRDAEERRRSIRARLDTRKPCPICGGKLTHIQNISRKNHPKNRDVWPAPSRLIPMCGDFRYLERSPICTRCWAARSFGSGAWTQQSQDPAAFVVPLSPGIAETPRPPPSARGAKWIFQRTQSEDGKRTEGAWLRWQDATPGFVAAVKQHAHQHGLEFREDAGGFERTLSISSPEVEDGHLPPTPIPGLEPVTTTPPTTSP